MEIRFGGVVAWCVCVVAVGCFPPALPRPDADAETSDAEDDTQETETSLPPPGSVTATTDLDDRVVVSWEATPTASGYRILRCEGACGDEAWVSLLPVPISTTSYPDETAEPAAPPEAPEVSATGEASGRTGDVRVTWTTVTAREAPRYAYRVVAVGPSGESAPSAVATGHLNERPVAGYEIEIDGGPWFASASTSYTDEAAAPATLSVGAVSASQGTFADRVELALTSFDTHPGAERTYRVRAITAWGPGEASEGEVGWRVAGTPRLSWERSTDSAPDAFSAIAGANQATFQDTELPADGVIRYYRARLTATGATEVVSEAVAGWRQARPGVPQVMGASTELADRVEVQWAPLAESSAYHVYRGETRLTPDQGVGCASAPCVYSDMGAPSPGAWAAPSAVSATTDLTTGVRVTWTPPVRPVGASQSYRVSALNPGGESEPSTAVQGWRAAPPLTGFIVNRTLGESSTYTEIGAPDVNAWFDADAPTPTIEGTIVTDGGAMRSMVRVVANVETRPAPNVAYSVRARISDGSTSPESTLATGHRTHGAIVYAWTRTNTDSSGSPYVSLPTCLTATCDDETAPSSGERRYYRVSATAEGIVEPWISSVVGGWRLAFVAVAATEGASCALTPMTPDGGRVWCWGSNGVGELGRGTTSLTPQPPGRITGFDSVSELTGLVRGFCARRSDGSLWCWGSNVNGVLGLGDTSSRTSPTQVQFSGQASVATVAGGPSPSACAIASNAAWCWGQNNRGQVGDGTTTSPRNAPTAVLQANATPLTNITRIAAGGQHSCARTTSSRVWCWGENSGGQLGRDTTPNSWSPSAAEVAGLTSILDVVVGWDHTCARNGSAGVLCWGSNSSGQLGTGTNNSTMTPVAVIGLSSGVAQVTAGYHFSCARLQAGEVRCWGDNSRRQLGAGDTADFLNTPQRVQGLTAANHIALGRDHACAIQSDVPHCWGYNFTQALGDGTNVTRATPVLVVLP